MKNLLNHTDSFEKLEELPIRDNKRNENKGGYKHHHWDSGYPYKKVRRFLMSRLGVVWDIVFSEFCKLTWLDKVFKNVERLDVIFNTLIVEGEVYFLEEGSGIPKPINDYHFWRGETFYVHPITKKLELSPKKKQKEESKSEMYRVLGDYHQLVKIQGIWHEIKGTPIESEFVEIDGLHYKKTKTLPASLDMTRSTYPPFPQKFFGLKVVEEVRKYKKTEDGYYLIPYSPGYWERTENTRIRPRELMVSSSEDTRYDRYMWNNRVSSSVKITMRRQLSSKQLKKYGLKNDVEQLPTKKCSVCGSYNCEQYGHKKIKS